MSHPLASRLPAPAFLLTSALAAPLLFACAEAPAPSPAVRTVAPPAGPVLVLPVAETKPTRAPPELKRDPYQSYLTLGEVHTDELRRTNLQRIPLDRLRVVGMVQQTAPLALLEDDSGAGYTVRIGTRVGTEGGLVKAIGSGAVVIEERFRDPLARIIKVEKRLELKALPG